MKIYAFYRYDNKMSKEQFKSRIAGGATKDDMVDLYALTNNKKLARTFQRQRDMDQFILIKMDVEDEDEFYTYGNKRRTKILDQYKYTCYPDIRSNSTDSKKEVTIVSTYQERLVVDNIVSDQGMLGMEETYTLCGSNPFILRGKFLDALRTACYVDWHKFVADAQNKLAYETPPEDEPWPQVPSMSFDELALFIKYFGRTFR